MEPWNRFHTIHAQTHWKLFLAFTPDREPFEVRLRSWVVLWYTSAVNPPLGFEMHARLVRLLVPRYILLLLVKDSMFSANRPIHCTSSTYRIHRSTTYLYFFWRRCDMTQPFVARIPNFAWGMWNTSEPTHCTVMTVFMHDASEGTSFNWLLTNKIPANQSESKLIWGGLD